MSVRSKFDIDNKPVHLQKTLTEKDMMFQLACIRPFDHESQEDYQVWCDIVNSAYSEENYTPESAKKALKEHPFLQDTETYFFLSDEKVPIGTISIGAYRQRSDIAGDFRLAVYPDFQNLGIGGGLLKYANHQMYLKNFRVAESIISYKRNASLFLHCKCGYVPQKDAQKWALKSNIFNRIFGFDWRTSQKADAVYQEYLKSQAE